MSEEELRAAIAEQDPVRDRQRGHELIDYVLGTAKDDPPTGIEAALLGSPDTLSQIGEAGPAPFWSVKARQLDLLSLLLTGLIADLEKRDRIWGKAREGKDVRAALVDWAKREQDALDSLQVTRQALNYALLHQLQDMMSPGYLQRTVKDMQARATDAYWNMPGAGGPPDGGTSLN